MGQQNNWPIWHDTLPTKFCRHWIHKAKQIIIKQLLFCSKCNNIRDFDIKLHWADEQITKHIIQYQYAKTWRMLKSLKSVNAPAYHWSIHTCTFPAHRSAFHYQPSTLSHGDYWRYWKLPLRSSKNSPLNYGSSENRRPSSNWKATCHSQCGATTDRPRRGQRTIRTTTPQQCRRGLWWKWRGAFPSELRSGRLEGHPRCWHQRGCQWLPGRIWQRPRRTNDLRGSLAQSCRRGFALSKVNQTQWRVLINNKQFNVIK